MRERNLCGGKACVVAMCALSGLATAAHAGSWEVIAKQSNPPDPATQTRWDEVRQGTTEGFSGDEGQYGQSQGQIPAYVLHWETGQYGTYYSNWSKSYPPIAKGDHGAYAGAAYMKYDGTARIILTWKPHLKMVCPIPMICRPSAFPSLCELR